ncbi:hypothetical protein LSTR_LSTR012621 [Laodelphax striatellus]|uniref:Haemolymph juvenile hormone binding protein n=1 Tax=Laodelphax striatellus TaxID=195883 RepID=A0A482WNV6_LAOST|nr:hypothetical protein LSTR_LSTR012621 [Laodelphax striatellus]
MQFMNILSVIIIGVFGNSLAAIHNSTVPPYVHQCIENDPEIEKCAIVALHHIRPYLKAGIPEIEMPKVEPFRIDSLSLALTTGPNGYKITLRNLDIFGASNYTIKKLKLSKNGSPVEAKVHFPKMKIDAKYTSSGVLIILPASGNGTFHADFTDVYALVRVAVSHFERDNLNWYNADKMEIDLKITQAHMAVKNIFNNNRILNEAINLFLRENGEEVIRIMMPQLRTKLAGVFKKIANQLLKHVNLETFLKSA